MKRVISVIMAMVLAAMPPAVFAEEDVPALEVMQEEAADSDGMPQYDLLKVGSTTPMKGDFFTDMWGNAASDIDVRMLIHSYPLIEWNHEVGRYELNPVVVSGMTETEDREGNRTFRISLYEDLRYSDGTEISASDYVFSILLAACPEISEIGGVSGKADYIQGYEDYAEGKSDRLAGVGLAGRDEFTVTVSHDYLPYFYELGLLNFMPYPIHVIAPGCVVKDDGQGAYIANADGSPDPLFTSELLRKTILDPDQGYRYHPSVTSGPYILEDFDGRTASFGLNPYFKGDASGLKPTIERLEYSPADNAALISELENGTLDLVNKIADRETLEKGIALVSSSSDEYAMSSYPRTGLSFLSFCGERSAVSDVKVRQAVAWCLNREAVKDGYEGEFGLAVSGYYGIGQWMYRLLSGAMAYPVPTPEETASQEEKDRYEAGLQLMESLNLDGVEAYDAGSEEENISRASALLEEAGWTLNSEGEPFRSGEDDVRCRYEGDELVPLELTVDYPEGNRIGELLEQFLLPELGAAGAVLRLRAVPTKELLSEYYGETDRSCDMIYLATNFDVLFDPARCFEKGEGGDLCWNHTNISDGELYQAARSMSHTEQGNAAEYCSHFVDFQERFSQILPVIPVYSNVYFDFFRRTLHNYEPAGSKTWSQAVVSAYLGDAGTLPQENSGEEPAA